MGVLVRELAALYAAFSPGPALAAAGAAGPVRRLRRLAARLAAGRGAGGAARLLAAAARRRAPRAGAAHRPAAPAGADATAAPRCRCTCPRALSRGAARRWRQREGATLFMALLAAFQAAAVTATRARTTSSSARPSPAAHRAETRGPDRLLRQHAGAARRPGRRPHLPRAAGAGARDARWAPTRTRTCPSRSWWRSCSPSAT